MIRMGEVARSAYFCGLPGRKILCLFSPDLVQQFGPNQGLNVCLRGAAAAPERKASGVPLPYPAMFV